MFERISDISYTNSVASYSSKPHMKILFPPHREGGNDRVVRIATWYVLEAWGSNTGNSEFLHVCLGRPRGVQRVLGLSRN
jgi:hypothetical protein